MTDEKDNVIKFPELPPPPSQVVLTDLSRDQAIELILAKDVYIEALKRYIRTMEAHVAKAHESPDIILRGIRQAKASPTKALRNDALDIVMTLVGDLRETLNLTPAPL